MKDVYYAIWNPHLQRYTHIGKSPQEAWRKQHRHPSLYDVGKHQRDAWRQHGFRCEQVLVERLK